MWRLVELGTERVTKEGETWKTLLEEYTPNVIKSGQPEAAKTNGHFRNTHTKIGQLFLNTPEVRITDQPIGMGDVTKPSPVSGMPIQMADILAVKAEYLNKQLGRENMNWSRLADALLFDICQVSGLGAVKIGYSATIRQTPQPVMGPDPNFIPPLPQPGGVLGLQAPVQPPQVPQMDEMGQPLTQMVPVTIFSEIYCRKISPWKVVIDPYCRSTQYDKDAGFMGHWFTMRAFQAKRLLKVTDDDLKEQEDTKLRYVHKNDPASGTPVIQGVELFIKATSVDPSITHPQQPDYVCHPQELYQLVLLKDIKNRPFVWRPCVDQTFDAQGQLTQDSIDRFPIQIGTLRDLTDSAYPQADAAFTNSIIKVRNTGLRQQIRMRDASIQKVLFDADAFEEGEQAALKNPETDYLAIKGGALQKGVESVMAATPSVKVSPDSFRLDADLSSIEDQTLGVNANSSGATNDVVRAATEIATVQQSAAGRAKKEQTRFVGFFLDCVRLIDIYISRYTTQTQYAKITGPDGAARIQAWNGEMVSGRWMYDIAPDSQLQVDSTNVQVDLSLYNLTAKDPLVDRRAVLRRIYQKMGYDPGKCLLPPQQMQQQPPHGGAVSKQEQGKSGEPAGPDVQPGQSGAGEHRDQQQAGAEPPQQQG